MMNQEFKAIGRNYGVLPNFGICYRELGGLKVVSFHACVRSFCYVFGRTSEIARKDLEMTLKAIFKILTT